MTEHSEHQEVDTNLQPGETIKFELGGNHLMLLNLKRPPLVGEPFPVALHVKLGGRVTLTVPVNPYRSS
ncbi:copper chaperone PCu(A)C [Deinococcus yavapaiensis]|uniref:Uncharacterized protein DUF461 n=1 Tax=Deinococcus yavapaiensis KR-236 TaxID=694435 RepID=A0A318S0T7_9DEIO|nr:copper chaperone PCu(A)C [Deinococcus yavapaiensis]PYE50935.1 uncharacterized protein DUF461 [Deinococcus yavapaiensis KR-236]